jgi:regulatory protein
LLGFRDRSRRELERRLLRAGFEPEVIAQALDDLTRAGLIDDERFAAAVADHARGGRPSGRRAVMSKLLASGVDRATAERAVAPLEETETDRADALAARLAGRMQGLEPAKALRRISGTLLRRGFAPSTAFAAARRALRNPDDEAS